MAWKCWTESSDRGVSNDSWGSGKINLNLSCKHDKKKPRGGAHGVMVIVVGNGHGDRSSNPSGGLVNMINTNQNQH